MMYKTSFYGFSGMHNPFLVLIFGTSKTVLAYKQCLVIRNLMES